MRKLLKKKKGGKKWVLIAVMFMKFCVLYLVGIDCGCCSSDSSEISFG